MEKLQLAETNAALERENRIIKKRLARSEANRLLLEEALTGRIEAMRVLNTETAADCNTYRELSDRLRSEIEQEYREKARINDKLYRLDRLNLIGEMAASIGHEVRNPLTTVRGYLQFFEGKGGFKEYKDALRLMIEELDRANAIITEFLSLAKNKKVDLLPGDIKKVLLNIRPMMEVDAVSKGHQLEYDLQDTPDILMDESEIRQLVLNLVRNGLEAMDEPGCLVIRTRMSGGEVLLSVSDSGSGIPPAVMDKIGTPFFTTKDRGSGLGLAVTYRIVERHRASISFDSSPRGTTVTTGFLIAEPTPDPGSD